MPKEKEAEMPESAKQIIFMERLQALYDNFVSEYDTDIKSIVRCLRIFQEELEDELED